MSYCDGKSLIAMDAAGIRSRNSSIAGINDDRLYRAQILPCTQLNYFDVGVILASLQQ